MLGIHAAFEFSNRRGCLAKPDRTVGDTSVCKFSGLMYRYIVLVLFLMFCIPCNSFAQRDYVRDGRGRIVGSVVTNGPKTIYKDASGRVISTVTKSNNDYRYRDGNGRNIGKAISTDNKMIYYDALGKKVGSAKQLENRILFRDKNGKIVGSSDTQTRDEKGKPKGRATPNPKRDIPLHMQGAGPRIR